jgi:L-cysteine/cystine lyase
MPALANKVYFNYGGQGPLPSPSLAAILRSWEVIQELGPFSEAVFPYVERTIAELRQRLSTWLEVSPRRLAFTENVSSGCVLPLWGLPWQQGDELLISDAEHPGVVAACHELAHRHGLVVASFAVSDLLDDQDSTATAVLERLEAALTPATRLVVLSHLLWNTGQIMPIQAVSALLAARDPRPWLLVDAAQSFGSLPMQGEADAADLYACTGHKWCCGPEGLGVVAVTERLLAQGRPTLIGWRSLSQETQAGSGVHDDARRFEVATSCLPLFAGLDRSLQLLEEQGSAEQRLSLLRERSQQLWRGLQASPHWEPLLNSPPAAGLVSFIPRGGWDARGRGGAMANPRSLVSALGQQGLWVRSLDNPVCLRACTHLVTRATEVDQLLSQLEHLAQAA